jgi:acetyltransferase-like isoleucine patch superfamily enzyme
LILNFKKLFEFTLSLPLRKLGFVNINYPIVFGDLKRITLGKNVHLYNSILNTNSGHIVIEDDVTILPDSILVTGVHDFSKRGMVRRETYPRNGRNIIIKKGAWLGVGVTVLGSVIIGTNTGIGAGSIVTRDIEPNCVAVGNPARVIKKLQYPT